MEGWQNGSRHERVCCGVSDFHDFCDKTSGGYAGKGEAHSSCMCPCATHEILDARMDRRSGHENRLETVPLIIISDCAEDSRREKKRFETDDIASLSVVEDVFCAWENGEASGGGRMSKTRRR